MKQGDFVRINYTGRLESGEIFDLTDEETAKKEKLYQPNIKYRPVPVIVGAGFLVPGLDKALLSMNTGERKAVDVKPEEGFGERKAELVRVVQKKEFSHQNVEPRPGMIVDFGGMKGRIQSVEAGRVRVDFNNPLAGKSLKYEIEVKEEVTDPTEQVKAILEFFGAENTDVSIRDKEVDIRLRLPDHLKERTSSLIIQYCGIEKVNFIETYSKTQIAPRG